MSGRQQMPPDLDARFDAELARAARALATEDLPRGILDLGLATPGGPGAVRARRTLPAYAGVAAVLVLLLATAIAITPGGIPPASPTPSVSPAPSAAPSASSPSPAATAGPKADFRTTAQIRADFEVLRYVCREGGELLPTGPSPSAAVREGAICTAPADAGPFIAAVIVSEARDGRVVQVDVKADVSGEVTSAARDEIAVPLAKAVAIAAAGQGVGNQLAAWVLDAVPLLGPSSGNSTVLLGFAIKILRNSSGSYQLFLHQA